MLSIGRAESVYVVPRENPTAADARFRGDRVLRERLPEILPHMVEANFPGPDVWLIERLDVDLAFAADALDDEALAHIWSQEIVRALANALRKRDRVLSFATRAAFVAQYVADLAAGRAQGRWYYAPFASLAALPTASAIREAIVREPAIAFEVLTELARMRRIRFVIDTMSDRGTREVWDAAFPSSESSSDPAPALVQSLLAAWDEVTSRVGENATHERIALHLVASHLERETNSSHDPAELRTHTDASIAFAIMLDTAADPWSLVESILDGDATTAIRRASNHHQIPNLPALRFFTQLATTHPHLVTCTASTILSTSNQTSPLSPAQPHRDGERARVRGALGTNPIPVRGALDTTAVRVSGTLDTTPIRGSATTTTPLPTHFAALALLLPPLIDLGIFTAENNADLRRTLLAKCAGNDRVLCDPITQLLGDPDEPVANTPHHDLIVTLAAITVMKSFAARLPGFAQSTFRHLRENFLTGSGTIRFTDERIDVQLPALPLALVLRLAGLHERSFALPWLPDRVVTLHLPEGT